MKIFTIEETFDEYRDTANSASVLNEFAQDLFEARLANLNYETEKDEASAAAVASNFQEIVADIDARSDVFAENPESLERVRSFVDELQAFQQAFDRTRTLQQQIDGFDAGLTKAGSEARRGITEIMDTAYRTGDAEAAYFAGSTQEELMQARLYIERFMVQKDQASFDAMIDNLAQAEQEMATLRDALEGAQLIALARETIDHINEFERNSREIYKRIVEQNTIREDQLDTIGTLVQNGFNEVTDTMTTRQEELSPIADAEFNATQLMLAIGAVATLVIGGGVAYFIGGGLSGATRQIASKMKTLADGDYTLDIQDEGLKNEIGEMTEALTVFKKNGLEREEMVRQQEAAAHEQRRRAEEAADLQQKLGGLVEAAVAGDFSTRIDAHYGQSELNELASNVNKLVESVENGVSETSRVVNLMAEGDLTDKMSGAFNGAFADLQNSVNATIERVASLVAEIQQSVSSMVNATDQISNGATQLSSRAESQASSLEETAATMEEMTATIKSNSESADSARETAQEAADRASRGGDVVQETVAAMERIEQGSAKIADIISVIDSIAFQTNLLALNAAVEAARAGDAGKGFAVVASEVRTLAQRSAEAAKDINELISQSTSQVSEGVTLVNRTGGSLTEIIDSVKSVTDTVSQISKATREQATGVEEISSTVSHMDQMTQENSAMAEESASAARRLAEQNQGLSKLVSFFRTNHVTAAPSISVASAPAPTAEDTADEDWASMAAPAPMETPHRAAANDDFAEF